MKSIGFKNFRNFEEFPELPINGVTFLVGQNNSGKSTFTRACRFLSENLKRCIQKEFDPSSGGNRQPLVDFTQTCKTYNRARYAGTSQPIEFACSVGYFNIHTTFNGFKNTESEKAKLSNIAIEDTLDDFTWSYDFLSNCATINYSGKLLANLVRYKIAQFKDNDKINDCPISQIVVIKENDKINDSPISQIIMDDPKIISSYLKVDLQTVHERLANYVNTIQYLLKIQKLYSQVTDRIVCQLTPNTWYKPLGLNKYFFHLDGTTIDIINVREADKASDMMKNATEDINITATFFESILDDLNKAMSPQLVYCSAHESPLQSYFSLYDESSNYASEIIRTYYKSEYAKTRHKWVNKWMQELGIGQDFEIKLANSEFISVDIINNCGYKVPLMDIGRGAVQIFLMLLRANMLKTDHIYDNQNIIDAFGIDDTYFDNPYEIPKFHDKRKKMLSSKTIIFEEPEQNLHPALQSKLADLFADIHKEFGYNVIVETHSEYLIRRTQALIATGKIPYQKNPFHVYYFPQGGLPYDMEYQENGSFAKKFGKGFYDEADSLALELL